MYNLNYNLHLDLYFHIWRKINKSNKIQCVNFEQIEQK